MRYDSESELYYLNSRYYDPEICRFIGADCQLNDDPLGNNLFAYCSNNPIVRADNDGQGWWIIAGAVVGGIASTAAQMAINYCTGQPLNNGLLGAFIGGAVSGAIITATGGTALATFGTYIAGTAGAAAGSLTNELTSYNSVLSNINGQGQAKDASMYNLIESTKTVVKDTIVGGALSFITGGIADEIIPMNRYWFKPQSFVSSFTGNHAVKYQLNTIVQSIADIGGNGLLGSLNKNGQRPTKTVFSDTVIRAVG